MGLIAVNIIGLIMFILAIVMFVLADSMVGIAIGVAISVADIHHNSKCTYTQGKTLDGEAQGQCQGTFV